MRYIIVILLSISISLAAIAQEEITGFRKFAIGLNLSPDIAYRTLSGDPPNNSIISLINKSEEPKFGYTGGLNLNYRMSQRLLLKQVFSIPTKDMLLS